MKILSTQKGRIGVTQMLFFYNHSVYGYCAFLIYHLNLGICITTKVWTILNYYKLFSKWMSIVENIGYSLHMGYYVY